jgi:valyl-tRNA synthetase
MGSSLDWSRERFTMDQGLSSAVREVFVQLYREDLIYRGHRLVNWDPVLHTAVSDLEVLSGEEKGHLWHMRYPLTDGSGHLIVATTRPETMLGDTAVAVHPDDERYQKLIGKTVQLPLSGRQIPIITDHYVDPEFGTGCVKITPAHDFNDYAVGKRHDLEMINIFTIDAKINENGPKCYQGLDRFEARKRILSDLEADGLLEKTEDHVLMIPRGDRSGAIIEPFLTDQWFVKTAPLAEPAIKAVEEGRIRFVPENWDKTYFEWMRNIEDWCISRQIWWGHRIPAWYDEDGNIYVGHDEEEARKHYNLLPDHSLTQDPDVLDTWFSSALWPFSTLGWPNQTEALRTFYPTSVLVTGFDIIFFWVARMIMMGIKFMGDVPFREVYIHGLVRDAEGQKMSKSKGNILDPIDLIDGISLDELLEKRTSGLMQPQMAIRIDKSTRKHFPDGIDSYGTDALRFTFASLASTGRDVRFDLGRIEGYRNFCNKLWNAARFVLMNTEHQDCGLEGGKVSYSLADRWIQSRLQTVGQSMIDSINTYRLDLAAQQIYEFLWNEYCDWYLEFAKINLQQADEASVRGTRKTLIQVLENVLRLLHPLMPFITEELWQRIAPLAGMEGKTIVVEPYPSPNHERVDADSIAEVEWIMAVILGLRRIRGEMNIPPGKPVPLLLENASPLDRERLERNNETLRKLGRIESLQLLSSGEQAPDSAIALVGQMKVLIPMSGLIDKEAELKRIAKETEKLKKALPRIEGELNNSGFLAKAPHQVVEKEKARLRQLQVALENLEQQSRQIKAI